MSDCPILREVFGGPNDPNPAMRLPWERSFVIQGTHGQSSDIPLFGAPRVVTYTTSGRFHVKDKDIRFSPPPLDITKSLDIEADVVDGNQLHHIKILGAHIEAVHADGFVDFVITHNSHVTVTTSGASPDAKVTVETTYLR